MIEFHGGPKDGLREHCPHPMPGAISFSDSDGNIAWYESGLRHESEYVIDFNLVEDDP